MKTNSGIDKTIVAISPFFEDDNGYIKRVIIDWCIRDDYAFWNVYYEHGQTFEIEYLIRYTDRPTANKIWKNAVIKFL